MTKKYLDEYKLKVVLDYYESILGVRLIAEKYGLPSKNYINRWEEELIRKGLLPSDSKKINMTKGSHKKEHREKDERTPREKQYEKEAIKLKAEIKYLRSLKELKPLLVKKK